MLTVPHARRLELEYIESQLRKARALYADGEVKASYELLIAQVPAYPSVLSTSAERDLLLDVYLALASIQMQSGKPRGPTGTFALAGSALSISKSLSDIERSAAALQLTGLSYRQSDDYLSAFRFYSKARKLVRNHLRLEPLEMHIRHDQAVCSFLYGVDYDRNYLDFAEWLFDSSNGYFQREEPSFFNIAIIRQAEMFARTSQPSAAEALLEPYEYRGEKLAQLTPAFQALFYRIQTEQHFATGRVEEGMIMFRNALDLNTRMGYLHQMKELKRLWNVFQLWRYR